MKGSHTPPTRDDADALLKQFGNATLQAKETSEEGSFECAVCHEDVPADEAQTIKTCGDYFCGTCAHHIVQTSLVQCPVCMGPFGSGDLVSVTAVATTDRESASPDTTAASTFLASGTSPAAEDDAGPKVTALVEAVRGAAPGGVRIAAASFDLHGNVSERLAAALDLVAAYKTMPHVDMEETKFKALRMLLACLQRAVEQPSVEGEVLARHWVRDVRRRADGKHHGRRAAARLDRHCSGRGSGQRHV